MKYNLDELIDQYIPSIAKNFKSNLSITTCEKTIMFQKCIYQSVLAQSSESQRNAIMKVLN